MIFPPRRPRAKPVAKDPRAKPVANGSFARVEAFRRAHDPLYARIAAHVTLVFPMARPATVKRRVARVVSGASACRIALTGTGRYPDGSVHLRASAGASALAALHEALTDALRAPTPASAPAYRPHVTVARAPDPPAARRLARAANALAPLEFWARAVSIVQEGRDGRWREIARVRLPPP